MNKLRYLVCSILILSSLFGYSQSSDFVSSKFIENITASGTQAQRFEIAEVGYNSHHWQFGGIIEVELFGKYPGTGYERYSVEIGYTQGTGTTLPKIRLKESSGAYHFGIVNAGAAVELSTSYGGYVNRKVPIYVDVRYYSKYDVKISYQRNEVANIDGMNQIKINSNPTPVPINDFIVPISINALQISKEGNMGIQNISPQRKLHIGSVVLGSGADSSADFISTAGIIIGSGKSLSLDQSYKTHAFIEYSPRISNEARFIHQGYYGHVFSVRGDAPALSILGNNGNVGIGTLTPNEGLEVGNSNGRAFFGNGGGSSRKGILIQGIDNNLEYSRLESYSYGENKGLPLIINNYGGGAVGIGTSTIPTGFKLAIAGKVITEKVVVRNSGNWPDYVFHKNYTLPGLSELEEFINSNNHLPEIPSAKEIEANGQDLGEMNRLLLKKVEELTLYIIEMKKKQDDIIKQIQKK